MLNPTKKGFIVILAFAVMLSYIIFSKFIQLPVLDYYGFSAWKHAGYVTMTREPKTITEQTTEIMSFINGTLPQVEAVHLNESTSAVHSTATILNYQPKFCVGDTLIVQIEMFNYLGKRKTYGGDFLKARIFSPNLGAAASGRVEDFNNGSYNVYFTLFWEGPVQISIVLVHPSEGIAVLWKTRNIGYKYIKYTGKFLDKNREVHTECGLELNSQKEICEYEDKKYGDIFYCIKLPGVPCEAVISMISEYLAVSYLTNVGKSLFTRSNIAVEISKKFGSLDVFKCSNLKLYNVHGTSWHKTNMAYDLKNNIYIQWKKHGHPLVTLSFFNMKDHSYTTNEIDRLAGGPNTIIVITLGQHFRAFPLPVFIKRILNVRKAIESLFLRSPDTKVILKSENTRDINTDVERFSDFHGYIQYLVIQNIFSGLNVGVIDVWDMTVAFGSHNVHPPVEVVRNQINLFLSYIC